jgi:glycosyltransferase involved in cell wall biosynthesis
VRILIFNWRDIKNPRAGGAETYTHEIAKQLVANDHTVTLFTSAFPGCAAQEEIDGVDIIRDGGRTSVYFKAWRRYKREFRDKYDFVIDQVNTIPFFTPLYLKDPGEALIFQITGEIYRTALPKGLGRMAISMESLVLKLYKKTNLIVISDSIRKELVKAGFLNGNISVVEPGLNHGDYLPGEKAAKPTVIFMNRIVKYKNVSHLLEAFKAVRRDIPEAFLMVGGCRETSFEKGVRAQADRLGLGDSVEFFPFVDKTEKTKRLQSAWVNVLPSIKEGWGMSVLEAAACGTPSVGYDVPGLRDAVKNGETGELVPYADISALSSSIIRLLKDGELRNRMSEASVRYASNFSWDRSAADFISVLQNDSSNQSSLEAKTSGKEV